MKKTIIVVLLPIVLMSCTRAIAPIATETQTPTATQTSTPSPAILAPPTLSRWQWSNALITFNDMEVLSESEVWVIGQHGTIIHDRPQIMHLTSPFEYPGEYSFAGGGYLGAIDFVSENDGWLTAWGGQIFHWDGQNWTANVPLNWEPTWFDIDFAEKDLGWVAGCDRGGNVNTAVLWQWSQNSWEDVPLAPEIRDGYCLTDINVVSATDVWVLGDKYQSGKLLHWDGSQWQEFPTPSQIEGGVAVGAVNTGQVWVLGGNGIYDWNGTDWTHNEMPVYFKYSESVARPTILAISQNNVWVGGRALFHWNGKEWEDVNYNADFGYIVDIDTDPDGNIWALTLTGTILQLFER